MYLKNNQNLNVFDKNSESYDSVPHFELNLLFENLEFFI